MREPAWMTTADAVHVIATSYEATHAAATIAAQLCRGTGRRMAVLVPFVSTYQSLAEAGEATGHIERYRQLAHGLNVDASCRLYLCRHLDDILERLLPARSTVVMGGTEGGLITTAEARLRRRLVQQGHCVVFVPVVSEANERRQSGRMARVLSILIIAAAVLAAAPAAAQSQIDAVAFLDAAFLGDTDRPPNRIFRWRGTTPRVDEPVVNMTGLSLSKSTDDTSRWGFQAGVHAGEDARAFGYSPTAPPLGSARWLTHLGPTNASWRAPLGRGLTMQGGVFSSLVGYDSLYAMDNAAYTRPWGAEFTPYLMLGLNARYAFRNGATATVAVVDGYWHLSHANAAPTIAGQVAVALSDRLLLKQAVMTGPHQSDTALALWRTLSDTIVEWKRARLTAAFEGQLGLERMDQPGRSRALWAAVQMPLQWRWTPEWRGSVRPEAAWDRDGRWTGGRQSMAAVTSTLGYRRSRGRADAELRVEHRYDHARGPAGGFYGRDSLTGALHIVPSQHLLLAALVLRLDARAPR